MRLAERATTMAPMRLLTLTAAVLLSVAASAIATAVADESPAYAVEVSDVTAKVGEHAVMLATLRARDGYRILKAYNNRVIKLSSWDDGVAFEQDMVPAEQKD